MGLTEEAGRVANTAVAAMGTSPLAIALLIVNIGFLGFCGYILGEVAENARVRNAAQLQLINDLVHDIRDCRQGPKAGPPP
jgi:hypothetical protein